MDTIIDVLTISYHRNGISGNGFHIVEFIDDTTKGETNFMIGIVFEEKGNVAVLQPSNLAMKWRGDVYGPNLRKAIKIHESSTGK